MKALSVILRLLAISAMLVAQAVSTAAGSPAAAASGAGEPFCETHVSLCPDTVTHKNYEGA